MSNKSVKDIASSFWARNALRDAMNGTRKKKAVQPVTNRWKIVAGDFVEVINGHSMGQRGKVLRVIRETHRVVVDNVNMRLRHVRTQDLTSDDMTTQQLVKSPVSIHYSNIALIDPSIDKPVKVGRKYLEDGTKVRVSKKTGTLIPFPERDTDRVRSLLPGPKDTEAREVFDTTFEDYEKFMEFIYNKKSN